MNDRNAFFENKLKDLYKELEETPIEVFFTKDGQESPSVKEIIREIKRLETIKKDREKESQLRRVNKVQAEKREIIEQLLSLDFPVEDIRTNDGNFHAVKLKKYTSLVKFMELHPHASFSYDYKNNLYTNCKIGGVSYTIFEPNYQNSTVTHEPFTDLESCLKWHGILLKEMTFKEFKKLETAIFKESERIKEEIKNSENKLKDLKVYFLSNENLVRKMDLRTYEYFTI
jgi:hypothetical protein